MSTKLQVIASIVIQTKQTELITAAIKECSRETLNEAGCISYQAYISSSKPDRVVFIETWLNKHALDIHIETPHFKKMVQTITPYLVSSFEVETLSEI